MSRNGRQRISGETRIVFGCNAGLVEVATACKGQAVRRLLAILFLLWTTIAVAQDAPRTLVRTHLEPPGPVVTGQQVRLVVDVLVTTWFTDAPAFPQIDVPGAVVSLSDEQPPHLTEQINGETWSGLSRVYLITPLQGGDLAVPAFEIVLHPGQAAGPVTVTTSPINIAVKATERPRGAENTIATTRLQVTQRLDRKLDGLRVGDAFTRTVEISADGVQAMLLPPTQFQSVKGLALYPQAPQVDNVTKDRQGFVGGRRVDSATYVVQEPGSYELPAVHVQWWDVQAGKLRDSEVPALKFQAVANPDYKPELALPSEPADRGDAIVSRIDWRAMSFWILALGIAALAAWLIVPRARQAWRALVERRAAQQRAYEATEEWAFKRFEYAAHRGDAAAVYEALLRWLERFRPNGTCLTVDAFCAAAGDTRLAKEIRGLEVTLYGSSPAGRWTASALLDAVRKARHLLFASGHARDGRGALAPLNPA